MRIPIPITIHWMAVAEAGDFIVQPLRKLRLRRNWYAREFWLPIRNIQPAAEVFPVRDLPALWQSAGFLQPSGENASPRARQFHPFCYPSWNAPTLRGLFSNVH